MNYPNTYQHVAQEIAGLYFEAGQLIGHENARVLHAQTMAQLDHSALAETLIEKGIFTREEYEAALIVSAEAARDKVNEWLQEIAHLGQAKAQTAEDQGG